MCIRDSKWGVSTSQSYFPQDNSAYFTDTEDSIIRWLEQYSKDTTETYLRGFLGKMLFSGEDVYKPVQVLSGGEKVRCMLSRMMMFGSNVLPVSYTHLKRCRSVPRRPPCPPALHSHTGFRCIAVNTDRAELFPL